MQKEKKKLKLKGKAIVFIDWANVYNWKKSLKCEVDPAKLFRYLKTYKEIADIRLYFGKDKHPKSQIFLKKSSRIGFKVTTKPVKYILVAEIKDRRIYRRKCDFDMEMCIDVHQALGDGFNGFIFFTGDGDFEPLYKMLIGLGKQVIVIYAAGHLGREVWEIKKGLFKVQLKNLMDI